MKVVVVGAGINGLFTALEMRLRGYDVTILDARPFGHKEGSSSEGTRNINVWRHMKRSILQRVGNIGWAAFEELSGRKLLHPYDCVQLRPEPEVLEELFELNREECPGARIATEAEILSLYPALRTTRGPGLLLPKSCNAVRADEAKEAVREQLLRMGAKFVQAEVMSIDTGKVGLDDGRTLETDYVIVAGGPWTERLLVETFYPVRFKVTSQIYGVYRFDPAPTPLLVEDERQFEGHEFYSMPDIAFGGVKCAFDETGPDCRPAQTRDTAEELKAIEGYLSALYRGKPELVCSRCCWYTLSPDGEAVIGAHPRMERVLIAHACGGGGFKLAPGVAMILGKIISDETPPIPLEMFSPNRFLP